MYQFRTLAELLQVFVYDNHPKAQQIILRLCENVLLHCSIKHTRQANRKSHRQKNSIHGYK